MAAIGSAVLVGASLLMSPTLMFAQHGGGGGGHGGGAPMTGAGLSSSGRPDGVDEKDELKDFHHAMQVQATSDQAAAFRTIVKHTEAASTQLASLEKQNDGSQWTGQAAELKQALEKARIQTTNFMDALSARQKIGLKEITTKVSKAESELAGQEKVLEASAGDGRRDVAGQENVKKALENFRNQQDRLALEMGIALSGGEGELAFQVPAVRTLVQVGGEKVAVSSSSAIWRVGAENGENLYKIELTADVSDLQPNFTEVLSPQVNRAPRCGERVELRDAMLTPSAPESLVVAQLYVERWVCMRAFGGETSSEIAEGSGSVEVKVTPVVADGALQMKTELGRVEAEPFLAELLKTGDLGDQLRKNIASAMAMVVGSSDFKATLPAVAAGSARMESARFDTTPGANLAVILVGEVKMSDEQATAFGNQLKQQISSQAVVPLSTAAPATPRQ